MSANNTNKRKNSDDDSDCEEYDYSVSVPGDNNAIAACPDGDNTTKGMKDEENKPSGEHQKLNSSVMDVLFENSETHKLEEFPCQVPGCSQFFGTLIDYDTHYNMKHRHACATCKRTLLSPHFLELHVLESHDTLFELMAERRPMFQCYVESCKEKFPTSKDRHTHGVTAHGYPKNFMYSQNPNKIHWQKPKSGKSKDKNRPTGSKKDKQTSKSACENDKMDLDENNSQETASGVASEIGKPLKEKTHLPHPHMHISFGHKATKVFSRKHKFGMKPERKDQPNISVSDMDLEELKAAIEETTTSNVDLEHVPPP